MSMSTVEITVLYIMVTIIAIAVIVGVIDIIVKHRERSENLVDEVLQKNSESLKSLDIRKRLVDGLIEELEKPNEKLTEAISQIADKVLNDTKQHPIGFADSPTVRETELRQFVQRNLYSILNITYRNIAGVFYNTNYMENDTITIARFNEQSVTVEVYEQDTKARILERVIKALNELK